MSPPVRILYFAALRDLSGCAEEQIVLPEGVRTVADLLAHLAEQRPGIAARLGATRVALDEAFADPDALVAGATVIALIPPVSGG